MTKEKKQKGFGIGTGFMLGVAVIYLLFGLAMVFVPQFKESYIIYIAGALFVIFGIVMIVRYFMTGSFRDIGKYGFSGGVLGVLIGICMLIRTHQITEYFSLFLGVCILLTAIVKLQNAVDLKSIQNGGWFLFLIISIIFLAAAVGIVLDPGALFSKHRDWVYYILIADGAVSIFSPLYLFFAIRASRKRKKDSNRNEDSDEYSFETEHKIASKSEDTICGEGSSANSHSGDFLTKGDGENTENGNPEDQHTLSRSASSEGACITGCPNGYDFSGNADTATAWIDTADHPVKEENADNSCLTEESTEDNEEETDTLAKGIMRFFR